MLIYYRKYNYSGNELNILPLEAEAAQKALLLGVCSTHLFDPVCEKCFTAWEPDRLSLSGILEIALNQPFLSIEEVVSSALQS